MWVLVVNANGHEWADLLALTGYRLETIFSSSAEPKRARPSAFVVQTKQRRLLDNRRTSSLAPRRPHGELACDPISDGVAGVGSHGIGFIEFRQAVAVRIDLPANLLKVLDRLFATRVNEQTMLTRMIAQHGVDAVDSILHGRIVPGYAKPGVVPINVAAEELLHNLPVGAGG